MSLFGPISHLLDIFLGCDLQGWQIKNNYCLSFFVLAVICSLSRCLWLLLGKGSLPALLILFILSETYPTCRYTSGHTHIMCVKLTQSHILKIHLRFQAYNACYLYWYTYCTINYVWTKLLYKTRFVMLGRLSYLYIYRCISIN